MKEIIHFDREFFRLINSTLHNDLFDWLMPLLRIPTFWAPLYIFLLCFILFNVKHRTALLIFFAILTVALTDQVSSTLIKHNIYRLRPCADEALAAWRRVLSGCSTNSSFTSSHAANHFGLAVFLYATLRKHFGKYIYIFFIWAFLISYAQVYVGRHYPLDVICGGMVGALIGTFTGRLFNRFSQKKNPDAPATERSLTTDPVEKHH